MMFDSFKKLFSSRSSSDVKKEELDELTNNIFKTISVMNKSSVMAGAHIAEECFQNGLLKGNIVKSKDIENYISQGNYPSPNAALYGFNQKMDEYLDSKMVHCYTFEGDLLVYVHKDHVDKFEEEISSAIKK